MYADYETFKFTGLAYGTVRRSLAMALDVVLALLWRGRLLTRPLFHTHHMMERHLLYL